MKAYQLLQDVLNAPSESGNYWHNQLSLVSASGLTQSNISKQLTKLAINGVVKIEIREYSPGKTSKHYCLFSKLNAHETAQQTALAQLRSAVEVLANDLKISKNLSVSQYQALSTQIKKISATVKGHVPEESVYHRQFNKIRTMFSNLSDEQVDSFTNELLATGSNRGAITDKYLILNAEQA